jgi:CubicO group peptidase (beta-lactamase class C family)
VRNLSSPHIPPAIAGLSLLISACTAFAGTAPLPGSSPEAVGMSAARLERLSGTMRGYASTGRMAGSVVLVARRGKIAYFEAFGHRDLESRDPMRQDTVFRIASQTKALVSVAAMILMEEGKLTPSDEVGRYLPEFAKTKVFVPGENGGKGVTVEAKRPITIRDLLTHTSGIGYGDGPAGKLWEAANVGPSFADFDTARADAVKRLASLPFDHQPGERWRYGYSTDVLGVVVERVSGMLLDEFLRTRICEPLGMRDTRFTLPASQRDRLATLYSTSEKGPVTRAPDTGDGANQGKFVGGPFKKLSGGGGMLSTAGDYARFLQMLLNGGELDGVRILSRKSVELMTTNHLGSLEFEPGAGFGLGFYVVTDNGARGSHGTDGEYGWGGAFHTTYWVDPREQLIVVYMTQLMPAKLDDHEKLRALVYQSIID